MCDNVNQRHGDYKKYAEAAGYEVICCVVPHPTISDATARNIHAVSREIIDQILGEWEE
ncbi:MAG: hypothetical protein Q8P11_04385 [bacterium]|nr:hypothetical protein [bacterium]